MNWFIIYVPIYEEEVHAYVVNTQWSYAKIEKKAITEKKREK